MENTARQSNGLPEELCQIINSLVSNSEAPQWTLKRSETGVYVSIFWKDSNSPAAILPRESNRRNPKSVPTAHSHTENKPDRKGKAPSRKKRDKRRLENFIKNKKGTQVDSDNRGSVTHGVDASENRQSTHTSVNSGDVLELQTPDALASATILHGKPVSLEPSEHCDRRTQSMTEPGIPALLSISVESPPVHTPAEPSRASPVEAPQCQSRSTGPGAVHSELDDSDSEPDENFMNDDELYDWGCFWRECPDGDITDPNFLKKCTRCRQAVYCSQECQRKHWRMHKEFCDATVSGAILNF